jgi:dipeptidyl aminopeptidase/acylaminoacyl peptidase
MNRNIKWIILIVIFFFVFVWVGTHQKTEAPTMNTLKGKSVEQEIPSEESYDAVSFRALLERNYQAPALAVGTEIASTPDYKKYTASYKSDDLTISGVLYLPTTPKPAEGYPVMVTNHGHIDVSVYTNGRGLKREQEYFASRGYVVFHPDYRNHAQSSKTEGNPVEDRLGYITDIIHAVESLRSSELPINKNNITLLGHSMGGGATLAAALIQPNIAHRIVLYAPVTVNYVDSYNRYQKNDPDRIERISSAYGTPETNKKFWDGLNGEPYMNRLSLPVQIYHGTNDADVPYEWATKMRDQLVAQNKTVELITYEGEGHEFSFAWNRFMQGVEEFTKE